MAKSPARHSLFTSEKRQKRLKQQQRRTEQFLLASATVPSVALLCCCPAVDGFHSFLPRQTILKKRHNMDALKSMNKPSKFVSVAPKVTVTVTTAATEMFFSPPGQRDEDDDKDRHPSSSIVVNTNQDDTTTQSRKLSKLFNFFVQNDSQRRRSLLFSVTMFLAGASLGPFLDSFHSAFGVLAYDNPYTATLWGTPNHPALITTWWVPELFGLAGFIIGWIYILLDEYNYLNYSTTTSPTRLDNNVDKQQEQQRPPNPSPPTILLGISIFTFQYWLSGVLFASGWDRSSIFVAMTIWAAIGFIGLDRSTAGLITSVATAIGGPLIEVLLLSNLQGNNAYHYNDAGETGLFPLWIVPVYFLGGPAVGNLARGIWNALSSETKTMGESIDLSKSKEKTRLYCPYCRNSRAVGCPNCDANGYYVVYGRSVKCNCCKGRGLVICRDCFDQYDEDPNDIEAIRNVMSRLPD